jgi:predicted lipoprotein with Yx(FWY)xxD motif
MDFAPSSKWRAARIVLLAAAAAALAGCGLVTSPDTQETRSAVATTSSNAARATSSPLPTTPSVATPPAPAEPTVPAAGAPGVPEPPAAGAQIVAAPSEFGVMLFDRTGQAIYLFDKETTGRPECYDACAEAWPPVLTQGAPQGVGEVRPGLLGTAARTDGATQVTYAGHPLYYYAHEGKNEVRCHNVRGFGGLWLVVTPSGAPAA